MKNISKIALIIFAVLGIIMIKKLTTAKPCGHVILLNGTSSAGKSAILAELTKPNSSYRIFKALCYSEAE